MHAAPMFPQCPCPSRRQRGGLLVQFAVLLAVLVTVLGVVDIGYMYYVKRDLQRIADLAALEGARSLRLDAPQMQSVCESAGWQSVQQNWPTPVARDNVASHVTCGHWEQMPGQKSLTASGPVNAAHVTLMGESPTLLPGPWSRKVFAEAIAKMEPPIAAFQVGSQLLRFNQNTPLGGLLGAVGLSVDDLRLLDSEGLANAAVTPSGLLDALGLDIGLQHAGVLTPEGLAALDKVSLLNLLEASAELVEDRALGVQLDALRSRLATLGLSNIQIPLGSLDRQSGIFAFLGLGRSEPLGNAMDVQLGLGDILKTAIGLGVQAKGHAIEVPQLNLMGLVKAKLTIVEPPVIAIGPVGTTGHSAQIRLTLNVDTDQLFSGALKPLVNDVLGLRVNLPIAVDVVSGIGELEALQCSAQPPTMDLVVHSAVLNACVGKIAANNVPDKESCDVGLDEVELVKLLHIPILSGKLHVPALRDIDEVSAMGMIEGEERSSKMNDLHVGDTVDDITVGVLNLLSGLLRKPTTSAGLDSSYQGGDPVSQVVDSYLNASKNAGGLTYNVDTLISLVVSGRGTEGSADYMPPLLKSNFTFPRAVPKSCLLSACPSSTWDAGTFSQAFKAYTSVPSGVLDLVGIGTFDNGYQSCAGLLSATLNWNGCIRHNLKKILNDHSQQVRSISPTSPEIQDLLNPNVNSIACNGILCALLKPVLNVLKPVLNGIGTLLRNLLGDVLGLELGRTDVKSLYIGCDSAQLVY